MLTETENESRSNRNSVAKFNLILWKKVSRVSKTDLTDFFEQWGFFYVGDFEMNDFGKYKNHMTQAMVDACKQEIKAMNLASPVTDLTLLED